MQDSTEDKVGRFLPTPEGGGFRAAEFGEGPNVVTDFYGTVGGGRDNQAGNDDGTTIDAWYATVGGGHGNTASGIGATVGGGWVNTASDDFATVGGGSTNTANNQHATVAGGDHNTASGGGSTIGGGGWNRAITGTYITVGGGWSNTASGYNSTIGGGEGNRAITYTHTTVGRGYNNTASDEDATVGGGQNNTASGARATVGGGWGNTASGYYATVGGGERNTVTGTHATVGGGYNNTASGNSATVGGGQNNTASGERATVPGGHLNAAAGDYSFAAGLRAKANHDGAFVWADSTHADFESTSDNQFAVRANGGAVFTGTNDSTAILNVTNLGSSPGILSNGGSHGVAGYGNFGVYGSGDSYGVYGGSIDTGVYGTGGSCGVYGYSPVGGVGLYARSSSGNPIEAYGSDSGDREFYVSNNGNVYADGTFTPGGADLAEMLLAVKGLEPGDVLVIGSDGKLTRSTQATQPTVVGVYSTQPGFLGGAGEDADLSGKIPLAVVGVVPVKASVENGSIQPGDLLTASNTPGHAMKASPNPLVGTVIGKALEGLDESTGVILMLVILQ